MTSPVRFLDDPAATASVHHVAASCWLGRFVQEFACAEAVVSEALAFLASQASCGGPSLLPHLIGQRFEALRQVVAADGPLAASGARVADILGEFDDLHRHRTFICHGSASVTADLCVGWRIEFNLVAFRKATVERETMTLTNPEAAVILHRLRQLRVRLDGQLRGMMASFRS
ncbi:hypothetical protein [Sphingomonas sp. CLY1604]|uniref:hypothetical protein n=1 Tax=Sphingomonas sp. CLY1604 TaxID=3457786 RepID=UPI003FD84220